MKRLLLLFLATHASIALSQPDRWQQRVDYRMAIDFNVETHQFTGEQTLFYFNNSPDTLQRVFYHLYFNAFQPGSMMDERSRNIPDPDPRVGERIQNLLPESQGFLRVKSLTQNGQTVAYAEEGTILEVTLDEPLVPKSVAILEMSFVGQVPEQIRRSGRDNAEGISYSMAQWYPKLCEYDYQGWHANPYIGREFYGVWGDFDVKITLDKNYIIGGTGVLQNADQIGYGYINKKIRHRKKDHLTWHFRAKNVHDFVWAADPDYEHTHIDTDDGTRLHFFYQKNKKTKDSWEVLPKIMKEAWSIITKRFGEYPYPVYSFIQGGDGGMEYPMATLITGERSVGSLVGVSVHELMHTWFQMLLGTNESLYAWMDEGFTSFASTEVMNELRRRQSIPGNYVPKPFVTTYNGYRNLARSGVEEPLSMHADHFATNTAYGSGSYTKGSVFLKQLEYIVGSDHFDEAILKYYYTWRFKHPNVNDFIRIFEKVSGLELDWYKEYFVNTTRLIEYQLSEVRAKGNSTEIILNNRGNMPMPVDVEVTYADDSKSWHTIPLRIMRGHKSKDQGREFKVETDWPWTHKDYTMTINKPLSEIKGVRIDPSLRLADINLKNNTQEFGSEIKKP